MRLSSTRSTLFTVAGLLVAGALFAQAGSRVNNWTVPPYRASGAQGGYTTMVDISDAAVFVAVTPCRVVDTRGAVGPFGGPSLVANTTRAFDIDSGPCAGIPAGSAAYSLSIGAILPAGDGFLTAWPTGSAEPVVSQLNFLAGEVIANAAIVPGGTFGQINVKVNVGTDIYIDINGYFMDSGGDLNDGTTLFLDGNTSGQATITGVNRDPASTSPHTAGVRGYVSTTASGPAGVLGQNFGDSGTNYGVRGQNDSSSADSAGVFGTANLDDDPLAGFPIPLYSPAGVRGESGVNGVIGIGESAGVIGALASTSVALPLAQGRLGTNFGNDPGVDPDPNWAVFGLGDIGASGAKWFIDPHPTDASKVIGYIALEGPEAGTYFRGRGKFERGMAKISIPEDFRMVTDPEGLTVQVTPIGAMATVGVIRIDLNEIVVQSSRNVEFSYLVQGVRATHKNINPIFSAGVFRPESAEAPMAPWLTEGQKRRLIANGTFREDGTVNMETARRLGWDRAWSQRENRPAPQPTTP